MASDGLRRTPLFDRHVAHRAKIVPFAGWEMPVQYAGVLAEANATRNGVGLFDVSHMGRVEVHGNHALNFLQSVCASDVSTVGVGAAQYSLLLNERGGIIDDIIVYRLSEHEWIVVINASNADKDIAHLRAHCPPDVKLRVVTDETALIAVQGPNAVTTLDKMADADLSAVERFGVCETSVADIPVVAARTGYTGEDGFELFCRAFDAPILWDALVEAGGVPCGLASRDTLRIEAALPLYGHEMDETVPPFPARLGWVVKNLKHVDFVGKSAIEALAAAPKEHVLVGLEMEGRGIPRENYDVRSGGESVGFVTSGTFSAMKQKGIALARVQSSVAKKGTSLEIVIRDTPYAAKVVALPFYKNV